LVERNDATDLKVYKMEMDPPHGISMNRPGEPSYLGFPTFSELPVVLDPDGLPGVDVAIVGAPIDDTVAVRPGARYGPRAIRAAGYGAGLPNLDIGISPFDVLVMVDHGDVVATPGDPARTHAAIRETVLRVVRAGAIPVVLGGDHSIAHPDVGAVAEALRPAPLGLVHFDAHADDAETLHGVVRSHGTPMRLLVNEGSVRGEHVVQVGLRGYWPGPEEFAWARDQGFRWHLMEEIHERGIRPVIEEVLVEVGGLDHIFLSIDIDVCDPAFAPGTGAPEPGGMTARDLLWAIRTVATSLPVAGLEVVEVSPPYDHAEITALLAHRVILEALSGIALRRMGESFRPELPL
jgi:agmatinase